METLGLFFISLISRMFFLFGGFPSITHDEADFYLNSYVLIKTGSDLNGHSFFTTSGFISAASSVPIYINSLFFKIFPKNIFSSRLPFAILNSLIPVFIYLIVKKITKKRKLSLIVFLIANFSPWLSYLSSQAAFDAPLALMFYLASVYFLISIDNSFLKYGLFALASFFSFNSYMGIKSNFIFLIFTAFFIERTVSGQKISWQKIAKDLLMSGVISIVFILFIYLTPGKEILNGRLKNDLILVNNPYLSNQVWYERLTSQAPGIINKIAYNKITVATNFALRKYFMAFDPNILFVKGDPHPIYGTNYFGLFYLWEIVLIIIGIVKFQDIFKKDSRRILLPFLLLLIAAPIPNALQVYESTIALRGFILIVPYSFLIGIGLYWLCQKYKIRLRYISFFYLLAFLFFFLVFQYKIKVVSGEQWHISEKILITKLSLEKKDYKKIFVYTNEPKGTTMLYDFYQEKDGNKIKMSLLAKDSHYQIDNVIFTDKFIKPSSDDNNLYIINRYMFDEQKTIDKNFIKETIPYIESINKSGPAYYKIIIQKNK